ncbi:ABC transporter ATP-binding protein [Paracoccus seriniphilus]|uniref:ATP-binding cassette, subfamily B n=1 Tax=Paracoccus seriniphilus TaxID=184748 RepID=A0A239Q1H3_9RHOB|nr:ABC transporter ATP-binding protein [Paracoccus seriniphilus]WCR15912.1 ABC transporter ATP-binding protein [Paracoccus seriniphilus]SNT76335.1 ATP-binding cassette, subfamily B [Paracoccus seriniphilus]
MADAALTGRIARLLFGAETATWITPIMRRAMPGALVVLGFSLTAASLGLALPMLTRQVIDAGIMAGDMPALVFWALMSFAVGLGTVGLGMVNAMLHLRASARMLVDLRGRLFRATLARDPFLPDPPLGEAMARLDGDCAEIQSFAFDTVLVAVGAVFRLTGGIVLMVALDWRMALLPLLAAPFELWFLSRARPRTTRLAQTVRQWRGNLSSQMAETVSSRATLRGLNALDQGEENFAQAQQGQLSALMQQRLWSETVGAVSQTITASLRGIILLVGGWQVIAGSWQIGTLVAFLAYAGMMSGPLRNLLGLYHAQARAKVAAQRLDGVMSAQRMDGGSPIPAGPLVIDLKDARADNALHDAVSARFAPGSKVLLDGPSGIGKSRLMAVLTRDAPLAEGSVKLNGEPVSDLRPTALTSRITHLAQRPALLRGRLRDNLVLADPDADDARLWQVLDWADLALWARGEKGLDTVLTETAANLSGGLRQRVAIARALLRPADVLIFDEAFSEIDDRACHRILTAIDRECTAVTRIFIAHSGPVRDGPFDQVITLSASLPILRNSRGDMPYQREKAREKAV